MLAGFLLTAVPNWTGRLPLKGLPLMALFVLWVAGRLAILFSVALPSGFAMAVDLAFPLVLGSLILREIVAGKNWRNLLILALLAVFTLSNALFHLEATGGGYGAHGIGLRLGLATALMMISVIGGRIIPSFTRSWLVQRGSPSRPAPPMQSFDKFVLLSTVLVLILWVARPVEIITATALVVMGVLHLIRQSRWQAQHTFSEPLVWVLHAGYAFIPVGAIALGIDRLLGNPATAATQHLWMAGAIGAMTLAVMTRATLGHTGQPLTANRMTLAIYFCIIGSVLARLFAPFGDLLSYVSGGLWLTAFAGFSFAYGPWLLSPKQGSTS